MPTVGAVLAAIGGCALVVAVTIQLATGHVYNAVWVLTGPAPFWAVALLAVVKLPGKPITSWLIASSTLFAVEVCLGDAVMPLLPSTAPWLWIVALVRVWVGNLSVLAGTGLIGLFPGGVPKRTGERWTLGLIGAVALTMPIVQLVSNPVAPQGAYPNPDAPVIPSPLYVEAAAAAGPVANWLHQASSAWLLAGVAMLYLRYRRAVPDERRRIRWFLAGWAGVAVMSLAVVVLAGMSTPGAGRIVEAVLWPATMIFSLVAMLVALSHQGVFGIDRPARRATVYRVLWLLIGVACVAVAAALGLLAGQYLSAGAAVLVTAAAVLLVQPVRRRLERVADRWLFGARLDGYQVLSRFGALLSTSPGSADLLPRLAAAVRQGLGLRWVRVRLDLDPVPPIGADGIAPDDPAEPELVVPLVHTGETIGRIECGPRHDGLLLDEDRRLLRQLAGQAASAVHNLYLTTELSARLNTIRRQAAELSASRARVVQAQDDERQRIQRDLHDGVQQDLVAVSAKLALARERTRRGDPRAEEALTELQQDLNRLLVQLREFAHTIHPPVLVDQGLLEAIEAQAARLPLEVVIEADPALRGVRYPPRIETATWYLVSEALTNAVKHAQAHRVVVAMSQPDQRLAVSVRDDGCGFDPAAPRGLGLAGLADRIAIVDGTLDVSSTPGRGTILRATIPLVPPTSAKEVPSG